MASAEQILISTFANLQDGTSLSGQTCPKCEGGRSKENSLSVTVDGLTLKWCCHRASCGWVGQTLVVGGGGSRSAPVERGKKPPLSFKAAALSAENYDLLLNKYGITKDLADTFKLEWTSDLTAFTEGRIVIPTRNFDLSSSGWVLRGINKEEKQKALIVKAKETMGLSWFSCCTGSSDRCIIVEDCYSAIRASKYLNAVALLGTYLSPEMCDELIACSMAKYYLALDKDAFNKSIEYAFKYKNKITLETVSLTKDIKNLSEPELADLVEELPNE